MNLNKTNKSVEVNYNVLVIFCPHCCKQQPQKSYIRGRESTIYSITNVPKSILKDIRSRSPYICTNCGGKFTIRAIYGEPCVVKVSDE